MDKENSRKSQFIDALKHMQVMLDKSMVSVEDVKYFLEAGYKLSMEFERVYNSRNKWRDRAEKAESKL